jgi:hypothetical protein
MAQGLLWVFTFAIGSLGVVQISRTVVTDSGVDWTAMAPVATLAGCTVVAASLAMAWRRYMVFKERWFLTQVAMQVHSLFDIDLTLVTQATAYLPFATPWYKPYKRRSYKLSAKEEWLDSSPPKLLITVPVVRGESMTVVQHINGELSTPPLRGELSPTT